MPFSLNSPYCPCSLPFLARANVCLSARLLWICRRNVSQLMCFEPNVLSIQQILLLDQLLTLAFHWEVIRETATTAYTTTILEAEMFSSLTRLAVVPLYLSLLTFPSWAGWRVYCSDANLTPPRQVGKLYTLKDHSLHSSSSPWLQTVPKNNSKVTFNKISSSL